jgi:hypothetical protein
MNAGAVSSPVYKNCPSFAVKRKARKVMLQRPNSARVGMKPLNIVA